MEVYGLNIPNKPLTNFDILDYVKQLDIPKFRGVFMRDTLPKKTYKDECGIVNFNTSNESGSHWTCWFKNGSERTYFDSFGQPTLDEVKKYLKNPDEINELVIQRNTDIVQPPNSVICGHLCLYVLKSFTSGLTFRNILNNLTTAPAKTGEGIKWTNDLADELHKPVRKRFPKRYVFVRNVDDIWGMDLVEMGKLARENGGFKYILMIIDVFSKYGWAAPLKTKTGAEVTSALELIFEKHTPKKIWVDLGREFYNKNVAKALKQREIQIYSTQNEEKCSVIERWNRSIKTLLWKYFTANGTHKWLKVLQPLITKYNTTKHRSIGFTPSDARKPSNRAQVFKNLYYDKVHQKLATAKFKAGDSVRLAIKKDKFEKAYVINWTDRAYTVKDVKKTVPNTYTVQDANGKIHKGTFYDQELQKIKDDRFRIEKILRYKTLKGRRYALVKWIGYDQSENTWEPEDKIKLM